MMFSTIEERVNSNFVMARVQCTLIVKRVCPAMEAESVQQFTTWLDEPISTPQLMDLSYEDFGFESPFILFKVLGVMFNGGSWQVMTRTVIETSGKTINWTVQPIEDEPLSSRRDAAQQVVLLLKKFECEVKSLCAQDVA